MCQRDGVAVWVCGGVYVCMHYMYGADVLVWLRLKCVCVHDVYVHVVRGTRHKHTRAREHTQAQEDAEQSRRKAMSQQQQIIMMHK